MAKIALMDSDAALRDVSALLFASAGYEVETLSADEKALTTVDWDRVDALIVGLEARTEELVGWLRLDREVRVPIVGLNRSGTKTAGIGMQIVLERPVVFDQVLAAVQRLTPNGTGG